MVAAAAVVMPWVASDDCSERTNEREREKRRAFSSGPNRITSLASSSACWCVVDVYKVEKERMKKRNTPTTTTQPEEEEEEKKRKERRKKTLA